jgi:hydroxypyruvate isomerase
MRRHSACLEMMFTEEPVFARRVALAKAAGFDLIEFWRWTNKDLPALEAALAESGMPVGTLVAEPMIALTDPANHTAFLKGLADTVAVAQRLGAPVLIAQTGDDLPGFSREEQRRALVAGLKASADVLQGTGVRIGIEPLNTTVDHAGYYLWDTAEGFSIIDEVDRPEIGMTYDIYHSAVMGETPDVITGRAAQIFYVQLADHPGRHEPGTGGVALKDWMDRLEAEGYAGPFGHEYRPTGASIPIARAAIDAL